MSNRNSTEGDVYGILKMKVQNHFGFFENWKNFYFVLQKTTLSQFSEEKGDLIKTYDLSDSKVVDFDNFSGKLNSFAIFMSDNKNFSFIAKNGFDKQRWMSAIDAIKKDSTELIDSILDATVTSNAFGVITNVNQKACDMYGYSKDELIGNDIKMLMGKHLAVNHDIYMKSYKETGKKRLIGKPRKVIAKHKNGEEFPVKISLGEISSKTNKEVKYVAIFRYIVHDDDTSDDDTKGSKEDEYFQNPQDPIKSTDLTKIIIETKIRDYNSKVENLIFDIIHTDKEEIDEGLVREKLRMYEKKLNENVEISFNELKIRMDQFIEKESILKRDITDLLNKYEKLEHFAMELKSEVEHNSSNQNEVKKQSNDIIGPTENWKLTDFDQLNTLGTGTFGRVRLVKKDEKYFAMKILSKYKMLQLKQVDHTKNEIQILTDLFDSKFVIKLYKTFKDSKSIYLILEYIPGGELLTWISIQKQFSEDMAKFFSAQILLGLESMHKRNIIYRDLKPENILLTEQGNVKICDFGFAKYCDDRTYTTCGTPEYIAPEVLLGDGHGRMVDWYSLGCIIFEMLTGRVPYQEQDRYKLFELILKGNIAFPEHLSKDAKDIIKKLMEKNQKKRLGSKSVDEIKKHPWFKSIDFKKIENFEIKSPISIQVKEPGSTKYFMKYKESDDTLFNPILSKDQQNLFKDF
eukprot:gene6017-10019_t